MARNAVAKEVSIGQSSGSSKADTERSTGCLLRQAMAENHARAGRLWGGQWAGKVSGLGIARSQHRSFAERVRSPQGAADANLDVTAVEVQQLPQRLPRPPRTRAKASP
jgi:hypothetical protein